MFNILQLWRRKKEQKEYPPRPIDELKELVTLYQRKFDDAIIEMDGYIKRMEFAKNAINELLEEIRNGKSGNGKGS